MLHLTGPFVVPTRSNTKSPAAFHKAFSLNTKWVHREAEAVQMIIERVKKNSKCVTHREAEVPFQGLNHVISLDFIVAFRSYVDIVLIIRHTNFRQCLSIGSVIRETFEEILCYFSILPVCFAQFSINDNRPSGPLDEESRLFLILSEQPETPTCRGRT